MSEEELNKKMEFIVEQQAQFAADIQATREVQAKDAKLLKDGLIGLVDIVGQMARAQMRAEDSMVAAQARTEESINRLMEAGARTDERLNNLISVVERHISGNGGPHSHA